MGDSLSWLICKENSLDEIKTRLRAENAESSRRPDFCVTATPSNHIFIFESRWRRWKFVDDSERHVLSIGREVYFCMLEEHVMVSESSLWKDGREIWRVYHSSEEGVYHLDARGQLPSSFEKHKSKRFKEQENEGGEDCGVDCVISIPIDIATESSGYDGCLSDPKGDYFEWHQKRYTWLKKIFGKKIHG